MHGEEDRDDERKAVGTPGPLSRDDRIDERFPQQAAVLRLRRIADVLGVTVPTLLAACPADGAETDKEAAANKTSPAKALFDHCCSIEDTRVRHLLVELVRDFAS